ncbi:MAG: ASKHA domain-containing protein [Candidatus Sumerlaeota bacterium]|nr:ASKHA domain-containing protein [Candidatus Sumerlaeota bacterium]
MSERVRIRLAPLGDVIEVARGTLLRDALFGRGVEFPCGGRGQCKGCRVRVVQGDLPVTARHRALLAPDELAAGWRLSCLCKADRDLTLELAQWETPILADETPFAFTPREGLGIAIDLGTTTLAAQLLDLQTGRVLAVRTALNPQARHGADLMSRISFAATDGGQAVLARLVRGELGAMVGELIASASAERSSVVDVAIVGNTAMHHLFCLIDIDPLSHYPFEPTNNGEQRIRAADLGWPLEGGVETRFLPCLGGFVGSDILAGILATEIHKSDRLVALIDLGTNGEIVLGGRARLLCASTAAGPAFEGARISMGMRAATGAIVAAKARHGRLVCRTLENSEPRGICGSGLVDVVACALDLGLILPTGRLAEGAQELALRGPVKLTQTDIRQLQLAKGAIAAGARILLDRLGAGPRDVERVYLAGAFGNYISRASARRIGLFDFPPENVHQAGNTALLGAKLALFHPPDQSDAIAGIIRRVEHVPLSADEKFQDVYVENMRFPEAIAD